jgi:hypothetical protein
MTAMRMAAPALDGIRTPDGRYLVVRGRLWRASNPALPAEERERLVKALMGARRAIATARRAGDPMAVRAARARVDRTKHALGERGPVWWSDGAPDDNRRLVVNTAYAEWYAEAERVSAGILDLLASRRPDASICPSDVARAIDPEAWRRRLDDVRAVARHLARRGVILLQQRGRPLDPAAPVRGPIRLRLA